MGKIIDPKTINAPATDDRYPDRATQEIAESMRADGLTPLDEKPTDPKPTDPATPDKPKEPEAEKPKDPPADPPKEPAKEPPKDPQAKDPKEVLIVAQKRKIKELETALEIVPQLKTDLEKLQTQIASGNPKAPDTQQKVDQGVDAFEKTVKEISDAHEVSPDLVKAILNAAKTLVGAGAQIDPKILEKVNDLALREEQIKAKEEEQGIVQNETTHFNEQFQKEIAENADVVKEISAAGLTVEQFKAKLFDFLYSEEGAGYGPTVPFTKILTAEHDRFLPIKKKSAEPGRGGNAAHDSGGQGTVENSAEEIKAMSPKEFEEYSNAMGSKSQSRITRNGKVI